MHQQSFTWLENFWEDATDTSMDEPVPNGTRCAAALGIIFQLIVNAEGDLVSLGKKAFKEIIRCIYMDVDRVVKDMNDPSWFKSELTPEATTERKAGVLGNLQPYFQMVQRRRSTMPLPQVFPSPVAVHFPSPPKCLF